MQNNLWPLNIFLKFSHIMQYGMDTHWLPRQKSYKTYHDENLAKLTINQNFTKFSSSKFLQTIVHIVMSILYILNMFLWNGNLAVAEERMDCVNFPFLIHKVQKSPSAKGLTHVDWYFWWPWTTESIKSIYPVISHFHCTTVMRVLSAKSNFCEASIPQPSCNMCDYYICEVTY